MHKVFFENLNNKEIVLKIIPTQRNKELSRISELNKEVEVSQKINHPNVLSANEYFFDDVFTAYSMEYVSGGSLAEILVSQQKINVKNISEYLLQICNGLEAIHKAGFVHRDIKPENILLDVEGKIKIADFGISAHMHSPGISAADELTGSINYLSPEYIEFGCYDERSDIYAIGVIAYELTTGKQPFAGTCLLETLTKRVQYDPVPPNLINEEIPISLAMWVMKAISRIPSRRFQTVGEMSNALKAIIKGERPKSVSISRISNNIKDLQPPVASSKSLLPERVIS
jgi:eukaryotic-like serine/threonine-protein kinase